MIRGSLMTRQRRVTDMLNLADERFLVLADVATDEFGTRGESIRAEFAQVNLASVLFAVVNEPVEPAPELRTPKMPEEALISVPPFKVTGFIHLMPERSLRDALSELTGHFLPGDRGDVLVGRARRGPRHGRAAGRQPRTSADPRAAPRGRSVGRPRQRHAPASSRRPNRPAGRHRLAVDRQVQPVAPLGPAAVVDGDVLVAEQAQHERELGGRHPGSVVGDHPAAAADVRRMEPVAQLAAVRAAAGSPPCASTRRAR